MEDELPIVQSPRLSPSPHENISAEVSTRSSLSSKYKGSLILVPLLM